MSVTHLVPLSNSATIWRRVGWASAFSISVHMLAVSKSITPSMIFEYANTIYIFTLQLDLCAGGEFIISQERDATSAAKARMDLLQAKNMITLLKEDRPGDLEPAKVALAERGTSRLKKVEVACRQGGIEL